MTLAGEVAKRGGDRITVKLEDDQLDQPTPPVVMIHPIPDYGFRWLLVMTWAGHRPRRHVCQSRAHAERCIPVLERLHARWGSLPILPDGPR